MARTSGIGSGLDDLAKLIAKAMNSKPQQKIRYEFAKKAGILGGTPAASSALKTAGKTAKNAGRKAPAKKAAGPKVGRIAKTPVQRPAIDRFPKGKSIAQTPSEQRATERAANRYLRRSGGSSGGGSKPTGSSKPVDVKGSIISPPSKATMRPPKPSNKSYEADPTRRFEKTPKKKQQKPRKGNQPKGTKPSQGTKKSKGGYTQSSSVKPKGTMSAGSPQGKATRDAIRKKNDADSQTKHIASVIRGINTSNDAARLRDLQAAVRNAKTPQARNKASKALNGFIHQMNKRK